MTTNNAVNVTLANQTGTGKFVGDTSPVLVTPNIGTPSAGVLTNCTGLPVAGGGTGDASFTAYAVICGGTTTTNPLQSIAGLGTSGYVLTSNGAGALPTFQAAGSGNLISFQFLTSGTGATYTKPANVTSILVECVGGGGGGGYTTGSGATIGAGGGGGAGGYCRKFISGASSTYTYTVGAGGASVTNGSATTFSGSSLSAGGGVAGFACPANPTNVLASGGAGGTSSGGDINQSGGPGGIGCSSSTTGGISGIGGNSALGGGAPSAYQGTSGQTVGYDATANSGAGGSGGASNLGTTAAGGAGGSGLIIVWEFS